MKISAAGPGYVALLLAIQFSWSNAVVTGLGVTRR